MLFFDDFKGPREDPDGSNQGSVRVERLSVAAQTRAHYNKNKGLEQKTERRLLEMKILIVEGNRWLEAFASAPVGPRGPADII